MPFERPAPGWPGSPARWTSSAKSGVGTALSGSSRVWFTLSHGILNEIYYPRLDQACTRDFGLIVTDGKSFFSEEKRDARSVIRPIANGVPAFAITSICNERYRLEKLVLTDPQRDVVLQQVTFHALTGTVDDYRIYALLAPHLVNRGAGNTAWIGDYKGVPMLFAEGSGLALAVGCSPPILAGTAGFVGVSDGWQDLSRHYQLRWDYDNARDGNVALTGEIDLRAANGSFLLAMGFGRHIEEAALHVRSSLNEIDAAVAEYTADWRAWQETLLSLDSTPRADGHNPYRVSTAVLRTHEEKSFAGGLIASLSIPWGFSKGDDDLGGYHLVWPRDLVETAGGLLAANARDDARRVIHYLHAIQEKDGHWPQNCWLDGTAYWNGIQMDECAFPILLADLARREDALPEAELSNLWPTVRAAASFIVRNGPVTGQDRWEEDGGYSPFTLAVEIAALLAAADVAERHATRDEAAYLRDTADLWNSLIERWIYATDTPLARQLGVEGYYVRIAPPEMADAASPLDGFVPIKNRPPQDNSQKASLMVSPDALALVRFGLRAPDDPRILNTVRVIDALLKVELPGGPCWRRYNGDGYGEHEDGGPFDGTGIGRPLAAPHRRARALRAGRGEYCRRSEVAGGDGELCKRRISFARAGVGRRRHSRARAVPRPSHGLCDAARLGACRAYQAVALAGGRPRVRHAVSAAGTLSARPRHIALWLLAPEPQMSRPAARAHPAGRASGRRFGSLECRWLAYTSRHAGKRTAASGCTMRRSRYRVARSRRSDPVHAPLVRWPLGRRRLSGRDRVRRQSRRSAAAAFFKSATKRPISSSRELGSPRKSAEG